MYKSLAILLILLISITKVWSQNPAWKAYTRSDGLPSGYIFSFYQDRIGKIWVASDNGVAVYNGKTWKLYSTEQGLSSSLAYCVFQDSKQVIWVGLYEGGMMRLNDNDRFTKPNFPVYNQAVTKIFEDAEGKLCFVGDKGVQVYVSEKNTYLDKKTNAHWPKQECINPDPVICSDSASATITYLKGKYDFVVIDKSHLIYAIFKDENKLDIYSLAGQLLKSYQTDKTLTALNLDMENNLWISTFGQGLYKSLGEQIQHTAGTFDAPVHALYLDAEKNVWVGNDHFFYIIPKSKTGRQKIMVLLSFIRSYPNSTKTLRLKLSKL